jgi:hypothetical protein
MHYLDIRFSIGMCGNFRDMVDLRQRQQGEPANLLVLSLLFGTLVQFEVAKKRRSVVGMGAAHIAPKNRTPRQLRQCGGDTETRNAKNPSRRGGNGYKAGTEKE